MTLEQVIAANKERQRVASLINSRTGRATVKFFSPVEVEKWVLEKLPSDATNQGSLPDASILLLPPVPEGLLDEVMSKCPDTITVLGKLYPLVYEQTGFRAVSVTLPFTFPITEDWKSLPDALQIPSGRDVVIVCDGMRESVRDFKQRCRRQAKARLWQAFASDGAGSRNSLLKIPLLSQEEFPPVVAHEYAKDPLTGEPLVAYGTVMLDFGYRPESAPTFKVEWFGDKATAEGFWKGAEAHFKKLKSWRASKPTPTIVSNVRNQKQTGRTQGGASENSFAALFEAFEVKSG